MDSVLSNAVLLATLRTPAATERDVIVVHAGAEAAFVWRTRRQRMVFADFGALSDGMTGVRLAKAIRSQCQRTHICLLSDCPRPDQVLWARSQGANEVLARSDAAIAERWPDWPPSGPPQWAPRPHPATGSVDDMCNAVAAALNEAGLGPAATLAVEEALQGLALQKRHTPLLAVELACAVSKEVHDPVARRRFLGKFGVKR